jgi:hypothetical protein
MKSVRNQINQVFAVFLVMVMSGCATVYPPPAAPVCAAPEAAGSVLCATAARIGISPEQIDAMFLDAALVGIGTKMIQAADLRRAIDKAKVWVAERDILSIDGLVRYLVTESAVDPALALLLSRRLGLINLPDLGVRPVTAYDKSLILAGLDHQLEQLKYF